MTPDKLISCARHYLGAPFRHMGRNEHGLDCIGLVVCAVEDAGLGKYECPPYGRQPVKYLLNEEIARATVRVSKSDIVRGDILVCRFGRYPQHVALYTGSTIIHSYEKVGGVIEHRFDERWKGRVFAAYRLRDFCT